VWLKKRLFVNDLEETAIGPGPFPGLILCKTAHHLKDNAHHAAVSHNGAVVPIDGVEYFCDFGDYPRLEVGK
jgi:hypothetical protein